MSIKKVILPLAAMLALSMVACSDSSSSSDSKISCTMTFMGSKMCAETSSEAADSAKAECVKDGMFITEATFSDGGCASGAVKSCQTSEGGVSGTVYFYDKSAKDMSCDQLLGDDEDDEDADLDNKSMPDISSCDDLGEAMEKCMEEDPDGCQKEQQAYGKCIADVAQK